MKKEIHDLTTGFSFIYILLSYRNPFTPLSNQLIPFHLFWFLFHNQVCLFTFVVPFHPFLQLSPNLLTYSFNLHFLTSSARIFQLNKCTLCHQQLDLPAVHFLCMHSFHQVENAFHSSFFLP